MKPEIIKLIEQHPELPIIPMVYGEVVGDDSYQYWLGQWGRCEITEYYLGKEKVHFRDDDEEDVLTDMKGCEYSCTKDGRDIYELSDEEWDKLYATIPWTRAIVVYITA